MNIAIIIPARYNSQRFPGKPLEMLGDKTILQTVYYNCLSVDLVSKVVIATDDDRIANHCIHYDMDYIMTSPEHESGTDRIAEAVRKLNIQSEYIINVQGDEPFIQAKELNKLAHLLTVKKAEIASLYQIKSANYADSSNEVKVTMDYSGKALYFSRSMIPFYRDENLGERKVHIGIYGFRKDILMKITDLDASPLEKAERLEQLRWLENGFSIHLASTDYNGFGIDTPDDLKRAKEFLGV